MADGRTDVMSILQKAFYKTLSSMTGVQISDDTDAHIHYSQPKATYCFHVRSSGKRLSQLPQLLTQFVGPVFNAETRNVRVQTHTSKYWRRESSANEITGDGQGWGSIPGR
jgi:hypothetical protein